MKTTILRYLLFTVALSLAHIMNTATGDEQSDIDSIKSTFAEHVAVSEAGDADAYLTYITDDAEYLGPGAPAVVGKDAIRAFLVEFFDEWYFSFPTWSTDEIIVSGDLAIHRYSGVAIVTPKDGGEAVKYDRKYMDVLRRGPDGQWLMARHMLNLNN